MPCSNVTSSFSRSPLRTLRIENAHKMSAVWQIMDVGHTGEISEPEHGCEVKSGLDVTVVGLALEPFKSVFVVGARP